MRAVSICQQPVQRIVCPMHFQYIDIHSIHKKSIVFRSQTLIQGQYFVLQLHLDFQPHILPYILYGAIWTMIWGFLPFMDKDKFLLLAARQNKVMQHDNNEYMQTRKPMTAR